MGRVGPAFLSIRRASSLEKPLVLVRLLARRRRNAQRTTLIRGTFFCSLAIVAKKVASCVACARRLFGDDSSDSFTVAFAHFSGLDLRRCCCCCELAIPPAIYMAAWKRVARRNYRMRSICDRGFNGRQLRVVTSRFYLRDRTLSVPVYHLVLPPSIPALEGRLVIEGFIFVCPFWISAFANHVAMDFAPALPGRAGAVRARIGATSPRSRSARADCDRCAVAADVRAARSDA